MWVKHETLQHKCSLPLTNTDDVETVSNMQGMGYPGDVWQCICGERWVVFNYSGGESVWIREPRRLSE